MSLRPSAQCTEVFSIEFKKLGLQRFCLHICGFFVGNLKYHPGIGADPGESKIFYYRSKLIEEESQIRECILISPPFVPSFLDNLIFSNLELLQN